MLKSSSPVVDIFCRLRLKSLILGNVYGKINFVKVYIGKIQTKIIMLGYIIYTQVSVVIVADFHFTKTQIVSL